MGCCPGSDGNTSAVTGERAELLPTPYAHEIVTFLIRYYVCSSVEGLFRQVLKNFGNLNQTTWDAEVQAARERFEKTGVLPPEILSRYLNLTQKRRKSPGG